MSRNNSMPAREILRFVFCMMLLQVFLFEPAASQWSTTFNHSCPSISSGFNITSYTIDLLPKDASYDNYLVQNTDAIISLEADFAWGTTPNNFSRSGADLFFYFWCFNETGEVAHKEFMAFPPDVISSSLSKTDIITKIKWKSEVRVPYNAKECRVMANAYGSNRTWAVESGCGNSRTEGATCLCFVDGLTGVFNNQIGYTPVLTFQEFFNKKQMEFNNAQLKFNDKQIEFSNRQLALMNRQNWLWVLSIIVPSIAAIIVAVVSYYGSSENERQKLRELRRTRRVLKIGLSGVQTALRPMEIFEKRLAVILQRLQNSLEDFSKPSRYSNDKKKRV